MFNNHRAPTIGEMTTGQEEGGMNDDNVNDDNNNGLLAMPDLLAPPDEDGGTTTAPPSSSGVRASPQDAKKRLMSDLKKMMRDPPHGISASPEEEDLFHWKAMIFGPEDTVWEGGIFNLKLEFTSEYPLAPPFVKFTTGGIFHPNVYTNGNICVDIMKNQWSPAYDVAALLLSIQSLLADPNPGSAANAEAAEIYTKDRPEYNRRVAAVVERSLEEAVLDEEEEEEGEED